jgi:hypothetical protein
MLDERCVIKRRTSSIPEEGIKAELPKPEKVDYISVRASDKRNSPKRGWY